MDEEELVKLWNSSASLNPDPVSF